MSETTKLFVHLDDNELHEEISRLQGIDPDNTGEGLAGCTAGETLEFAIEEEDSRPVRCPECNCIMLAGPPWCVACSANTLNTKRHAAFRNA